MTALYNFRNILDVEPEREDFHCVGIDENRHLPQRCRIFIPVEDRDAASRILNEMNLSPDDDQILRLLPVLVSRTLCSEIHRSRPESCQVGQVYMEWRDIIRDHSRLVKRESSTRAFENWKLRRVKGLESLHLMEENEKADEHNFRTDSVNSIKHRSRPPKTVTSTVDEPFLTNHRNTFGNYTLFSPTLESKRSSHLPGGKCEIVETELSPPRRRTWPEDEEQLAPQPLATRVPNSITTPSLKPDLTVEINKLSHCTPPNSTIKVHITSEEDPILEISPRSNTPIIPPKSPLRAPCLERLSFVSSISCTSLDTLPSPSQLTPSSINNTPPLPSPTPQSPHAIPWFLRQDFSVPAPDLPSELPSRTGSSFRTSAIMEVEAEVCGVCMLARGEEGCTCCWGDLMFSDEEEGSVGGSGRSEVKAGCLRPYRGWVRRVWRRIVRKKGEGCDEKGRV